jgi:serine/threonine protein kinase
MDVVGICENGHAAVVRQEIHCGLLLSDLVRAGVCPHFVELYQIFQHATDAPAHCWGSEDERAPLGPTPPARLLEEAARGDGRSGDGRSGDGRSGGNTARGPRARARRGRRASKDKRQNHRAPRPDDEGVWQFLRMELCDGSDLEEHLRGRSDGQMPVRHVPGVLLQMVASIYVARVRFSMRHYDVKLLNFFLRSATSCLADARGHSPSARTAPAPAAPTAPDAPTGPDVHIVYRIEGASGPLFRVPARGAAAGFVVKLADYGTADMDESKIGAPIEHAHFTTLENAPPEFLLLGRGAKQGFAADAWALGLCAVHLLTGHAPYEEILSDVRCPDGAFKRALLSAWSEKDPHFGVVWEGVGGEEDALETLADTLWRFLVLLAPGRAGRSDRAGPGRSHDGGFHGRGDFRAEAWREAGSTPSRDASHKTRRKRCGGGRASSRNAHGKGPGRLLDAVRRLVSPSCRSAEAKRLRREQERWSLFFGDEAVMVEARRRMDALPGGGAAARRWLDGLLSFSPLGRATMRSALEGELFRPFRCAGGEPQSGDRGSHAAGGATAQGTLECIVGSIEGLGPDAPLSAVGIDALPDM